MDFILVLMRVGDFFSVLVGTELYVVLLLFFRILILLASDFYPSVKLNVLCIYVIAYSI